MKKLMYLIFFLILSNKLFAITPWDPFNYGISSYDCVKIYDFNNTLFLCTYYNLHTAKSTGTMWTQLKDPLTIGASDILNKDSILIIVGSLNSTFLVSKSIDFGKTWYKIENGLSGGLFWEASLARIDDYIFIGSTGGIYRSSNMGEGEWETKNNFVNLEDWKPIFINKVLVVGKDLYVATNNIGVYKSTDLGETWIEKNNGLTFMGVFDIQCFDNVLYASTFGGGLCRSSDWGESWESIIPVDWFFPTRINTVCVIGDIVLAGSYDMGIYISRNGGKTWWQETSSASSGLFNSVKSFLVKDDGLYVAFLKDGVWRTKLSNITSVKSDSWEPVSNISPNPASDYININLSFLRMQESAIQIFDIFGKCVLVAQTPSSEQRIDVSSLSAGVYFLRAGSEVYKFVIVR